MAALFPTDGANVQRWVVETGVKAPNVIRTLRLLRLVDWKLRLEFHDRRRCTCKDSNDQVKEYSKYECTESKKMYMIFKVGHSFICGSG